MDDMDMKDGPTDEKEVSQLEDLELLQTLSKWFEADKAHSNDWRERAAANLDFASGTGQWKKETKASMEAEDRVAITFNITLPVLKAVSGIEVNTRHETVFLPRGTEEGDIIANELLTIASKWMGDGCNAQYHESQAFQYLIRTGMGWCEERLDYEINPDGQYIEENINPLEMYWDAASCQMNLMDSRRRWRARKMGIADARAMFPGVPDDELNCAWPGSVGGGAMKSEEERRSKLDDNVKKTVDGEVTILQVQWWEREKYNRVANPFTGEVESMDDKSFKDLQKAAKEYEETTGQPLPVEAINQTRRVYKQAFIGSKVLKKGPCPRKDGFTLNCMTGEYDANTRTWFCLVDMMRDPQMMTNKWLSQATHIINTTAKGGILAEEDAFTDQREAEGTYARPDAITWVKKGAIGAGKIMQKPGVGLAAPYLQLMTMAMDAMPRVTGINMELMGLRDAQQPGILEAQRKQSAMTILATVFDSLQAFRIESGRTRLHFIQNHLADGRLIRVVGENGNYRAVKLMKDKVVGEHDVVVSEAPTSPNQKEQVWGALQSVIPIFRDRMTPALGLKLLEFVPGLPKNIIDEFRKIMDEESQPSPEAMAESAAVKRLEFDGKAAKVNRDKAAAARDAAQAKKTLVEAALEAANVTGKQMQNAQDGLNVARAVRAVRPIIEPSPVEYAVAPMAGGNQLPLLPILPDRAGVMSNENGSIEGTSQ